MPKAPALMLASDRVKAMKERKNKNTDITGKSTVITMEKKTKPTPTPKAKPTASKPSATRVEFNKAFAAARKAGQSVFTFRGKSYTTKVK